MSELSNHNSPSDKNDDAFDLSQFTYTHNLSRVTRAAADGRLEEIEGYSNFRDKRVLGYDLLRHAFVSGGRDRIEVENKLVELYGEDYSFRFTIFERTI